MPGSSLAIGAGRWCQMMPRERVRMWVIHLDEHFLRTQMAWFLPDKSRINQGLHPDDWDGHPLLLRPGLPLLHRIEPIWRQLSVLRDCTSAPELAAIRTVELFAQWVSLVAHTFLSPHAESDGEDGEWRPVSRRAADLTTVGSVGRATALLREHMERPWTVAELSREVALSRTHLTRLFSLHTGVAPMRYLTEIRLTEFTRLIEETDLSVGSAASQVGWSDARVASTWFRRRHGTTPSRYRTQSLA